MYLPFCAPLAEPVPTLCLGDVADGKGCWVGGKQVRPAALGLRVP